MNESRTIDRSGFTIITLQLEGLCDALRATVPQGLIPGPGTIQILKKLRDDWASCTTGRALENLPEIDDHLQPVDVLAMAETLRATAISFMSPDEFDKHHRAFGFDPGGRTTPK